MDLSNIQKTINILQNELSKGSAKEHLRLQAIIDKLTRLISGDHHQMI